MLRIWSWKSGGVVLSGLAMLAAPGLAVAGGGSDFERAKQTILSLTGCYLVDYSYTETESLQPGYSLDPRVYDVNSNKSIKEWIVAQELSPTRIRLQHILFGTGLDGRLMEGSLLKHQAEDWEFEPGFRYDFTGPSRWEVQATGKNEWVRRITNLDDGLRYQCAAPWKLDGEYAEWTCANYAPIPGRETRDMGRKDYNTLDRVTRIVSYGNNWLERQNNTKTIHDAAGKKPLARELGKNWYVRLPDSECADAQAFAAPRSAFWDVLRDAWDSVLTGDRAFIETVPAGQPSRYGKMMEIEARYLNQDLSSASTRASAKTEILELIRKYRAE